MLMQSQVINVALMKMSYHGPVTISAYGDTNGIPLSHPQFLSSTGIGLNHVPDGKDDLCGSMSKGDVRPEFSLIPSSSGISKSVAGISDLDIQLPERIQCLLRVIFLLLHSLKLEKIVVPTKENIVHCIRYSVPKYRHTDVTIALDTALELQMILKVRTN